jgi:putative endonuclease
MAVIIFLFLSLRGGSVRQLADGDDEAISRITISDMRERYYYVYINTNKWHSVLYTGVTNNLLSRNHYHKAKENKQSFTAEYKADKLVYYEVFNNINDAITREKQIKGGSRKKKIDLINKFNSKWRDLSEDLGS